MMAIKTDSKTLRILGVHTICHAMANDFISIYRSRTSIKKEIPVRDGQRFALKLEYISNHFVPQCITMSPRHANRLIPKPDDYCWCLIAVDGDCSTKGYPLGWSDCIVLLNEDKSPAWHQCVMIHDNWYSIRAVVIATH